MSCTAADIAEKKRQAMERLKHTKASAQTTPNSKNSTSTETTNKNTFSFYGSATNEKTNTLNKYENKMKQQPTYRQSNRISSQPYPRNGNTSPKATNNNEQKIAPVFKNVVTCTCTMISPKRFQVIQKGYHAKLIDVFKTIPTRSFGKQFVFECNNIHQTFIILYTHFLFTFSDTGKKIWSFDLSAYDEVQKKVGELNPHVVMGVLPKFVLKLLKSGKYCIFCLKMQNFIACLIKISEEKEPDLFCLDAIEKKLSSQLLEFQKYGVAFGISHSGRCMIADDMGLGKLFFSKSNKFSCFYLIKFQ